MLKPSGRFWTIPNLLTLLRIALMPIFLIFLAQSGRFAEQMVWAILAVGLLTDVLDGFIARRFGMVSEWGKFLDPLADKLGAITVGIGLVLWRDFPLWAVLAVLGRDLFIGVGAIAVLRKTGLVPSSNTWGKLTSIALGATFFLFLIREDDWGYVTLVLMFAFWIVSIWAYARYGVQTLLKRLGKAPAHED